MNQEQIKNPNRIYPDDVIVVDRSAQQARMRLLALETVKLEPGVRVEPLAPKPVPTIPTAVIEPFLAKPLIVGPAELDAAPRISATQENRVAIGAGAIAYAAGLTQDKGTLWQVFRRGDPLFDPDSGEILGYEAVYLGDAHVLKFADESTLQITKSTQEIYTAIGWWPQRANSPLSATSRAPRKNKCARVSCRPTAASARPVHSRS